VDSRGVPLSIVVTGANRHDVTQLELVSDEIIIDRSEHIEQHLCADKGCSDKPACRWPLKYPQCNRRPDTASYVVLVEAYTLHIHTIYPHYFPTVQA